MLTHNLQATILFMFMFASRFGLNWRNIWSGNQPTKRAHLVPNETAINKYFRSWWHVEKVQYSLLQYWIERQNCIILWSVQNHVAHIIMTPQGFTMQVCISITTIHLPIDVHTEPKVFFFSKTEIFLKQCVDKLRYLPFHIWSFSICTTHSMLFCFLFLSRFHCVAPFQKINLTCLVPYANVRWKLKQKKARVWPAAWADIKEQFSVR